ncbi:hypothetical protein STEG23_014733, partial [Scotinomys teguina]
QQHQDHLEAPSKCKCLCSSKACRVSNSKALEMAHSRGTQMFAVAERTEMQYPGNLLHDYQVGSTFSEERIQVAAELRSPDFR